jgi:hypothetical protein
MAQQNRKGESGIIPSRSDRFYSLESVWFFATREGAAIGPFATHEEALNGLTDFLEFLILAAPITKKKLVQSMEH